ncbi:MAG: hypothetical protein HY457_01280 [Parcubacteria group bacterium]|nr:hypothetical protein [Parcubacteria group bacterium]
MGTILEESDRNRLIQTIINRRFPSDSPEDRLGAQALRRKLEGMGKGKLRKLLERAEDDE